MGLALCLTLPYLNTIIYSHMISEYMCCRSEHVMISCSVHIVLILEPLIHFSCAVIIT